MAMTLAEALDKVFEIDLGLNTADAQSMLSALNTGGGANVSEATLTNAGVVRQMTPILGFSNAEEATAEGCASAINAILTGLIQAGIMYLPGPGEEGFFEPETPGIPT